MISYFRQINRGVGSVVFTLPAILTLTVILFSSFGLPIQTVAQQETASKSATEQLTQLRSRLSTDLQKLAEATQNMPAAGDHVLSWLIPRDSDRQFIFMPPARNQLYPDGAREAETRVYDQLNVIKKHYAADLFELVPAILKHDNAGAQAYQMLHEVLVFDPDHEKARLALGFKLHFELGWVRSRKSTQSAAGRTRQKAIGWEKNTYHTIKSPHFVIHSAAGEQAGLDLAEELERTYWVWRQVFFDYWCNSRKISDWLDGNSTDRSNSRQYNVILFRDRQQYLADLAQVDGIEISTGYYDEVKKASFFYMSDDPAVSTWRHETIHQLLQQNAGREKTVSHKGHAWLVEGIAMYFETMQNKGNVIILGGFDTNRLQFARLRSKREQFFVPMPTLDSMNRKQLQLNPDVRALYTQAAGVCQFLFAHDHGQYRNGFVRFIKDFYQQRNPRLDLGEETLPLDQLDRAYMESMLIDGSRLNSPNFNRNATGLALGRSGLENSDIRNLKYCKQLQWLELSENPKINDSGLDHLAGLEHIFQLFLDVTTVTNACGEKLAAFKKLQELDLASTRFGDEGLRELESLPELSVFWLANTQVTDAGIESLIKMPALTLVDLRKTKVTAAGIQRLKAAKPKLEVMFK